MVIDNLSMVNFSNTVVCVKYYLIKIHTIPCNSTANYYVPSHIVQGPNEKSVLLEKMVFTRNSPVVTISRNLLYPKFTLQETS